MSPIRTLLLCTRLPFPPLGGDRLRVFQLARALASLGPVELIAPREAGDDLGEARRGLPFVSRLRCPPAHRFSQLGPLLRGAVQGSPLQQALYDHPGLRAEVLDALPTVDLVVCHLLRPLPWLPATSPPLLICLQDALAAQAEEAMSAPGWTGGWRRLALAVERSRLPSAEADAVARADGLSFITARDRDAVLADRLDGPPSVVTVAAVDRIALRPQEPTPDRIVFAGNLRTASNQDMAVHLATRLFPMIRSARPEAHLHLVGIDAPPAIRRLGGRPGVHFVGPVQDMAATLAQAAVTICPLRFGSGVQNKVLESLAAGTPCVVTERVALALHPDAVLGGAVAVGRSDRSLVVRVVEILSNPSLRQRAGEAGIRFVAAHHDPHAAFAPLLELATKLARPVRAP